MRAIRRGEGWPAIFALIGIGFLYGVVHALGPGHGKVVVTAYFMDRARHWSSAIFAGSWIALGHTISAILIVLVLAVILRIASLDVVGQSRFIEIVAYGMIVAIGLWRLVAGLRGTGHDHSHGDGHGHHECHRHDHQYDHGHQLHAQSLDRPAATLSGGEGQRIRLATQIGSSLVGVFYILDEPSIGLHQRDNQRLLGALKRLRDMGNSVLVVEHDEESMQEADYIIDMGPGAAVWGGEVVAKGTFDEICANEKSLTGKYLSGALEIHVTIERKKPDKRWLVVKEAKANNLKLVTASFPIGLMTCVTGVSGSGKSTLVIDTLYKSLARKLFDSKERSGEVGAVTGLELVDKVIDIDQSPIGRTPRSNPATYTP